MLFHTSTFFAFFAAFLACYLPVRRKPAGVWVILVFSNIFYGWWNWKFLFLLWTTILVDYSLANLLARTEAPVRRKLLIGLSLLTNLGILAFFKYYNFFVASIVGVGVEGAASWHILDLTLPVGISFYVFQSMSYTLDVYRRQQQPVRNLLHFAAFVCYFPQLVAGPINRLTLLLPQIIAPASITPDRVTSGAFLFCIGFFRKALADTFATFVDPVFNNVNDATPAEVVFAVFGFGLQIYLDFTGYVDMARGISRTIGIELMLNFDAPYLSTSPREFWRRWHISLSRWLRDYLYISLGGNRHGMPRHLLALMLTMILGGLWHGAGWNFAIWGALHGSYLVLNVLWDRATSGVREAREPRRILRAGRLELWIAARTAAATARPLSATGRRVRSMAGWLVTFLAVNYAWLYFRSHTFEASRAANRKIGAWLLHPSLPTILPALVLMVAIVVAMEFILRFRPGAMQGECSELTLRRAAVEGAVGGALVVAGLVLLSGVPTQQFIYFQF
jgi:alginate O-acetyltransferase complex protein AlgI